MSDPECDSWPVTTLRPLLQLPGSGRSWPATAFLSHLPHEGLGPKHHMDLNNLIGLPMKESKLCSHKHAGLDRGQGLKSEGQLASTVLQNTLDSATLHTLHTPDLLLVLGLET
jgi:hypothetical protein